MEEIKKILSQFPIGEVKSVRSFGNGHINRTYLVEADGMYTFQELNTYVFPNPHHVMENIVRVTEFLREKIKNEGGDTKRETPSVVRTHAGELLHFENEKCYRMLRFISASRAYEHAETPDVLRETGKAFGRFQRRLSDFPAEKLHETISDFHHTPRRFQKLLKAMEEDRVGRRAEVEDLIEEALSWENFASLIVDGIAAGEIPLRVTHNDTKLGNVLLDDETGEGICVIDLDTVMPGSVLYDFGEAIRSGVTFAEEDETDSEKIIIQMPYFKAYAEGFLSEVGKALTTREWELLPKAAQMMTLENGVRFLTDFLEGDPYYGEQYGGQNKNRATMHLMLLQKLKEKEAEMEAIIQNIRNKKRDA